jgi:hypothetical protein
MCNNGVVAVMGNKFKTVCTCVLSFVSPSGNEFTKDHHQNAVASGFFISLIASTVLHTIAVHLHGWLGRKHRTHYTRGLNATSVGLATGKSQVHGGTRPVDKANKPVMRTWGFLLSKAHKAWSGRLENLSIHPW